MKAFKHYLMAATVVLLLGLTAAPVFAAGNETVGYPNVQLGFSTADVVIGGVFDVGNAFGGNYEVGYDYLLTEHFTAGLSVMGYNIEGGGLGATNLFQPSLTAAYWFGDEKDYFNCYLGFGPELFKLGSRWYFTPSNGSGLKQDCLKGAWFTQVEFDNVNEEEVESFSRLTVGYSF